MSHFLSPGSQQLIGPTAVAVNTSGILFLEGLCSRVTIVLQSTGTTSGGTVLVEEAYYPVQGTPYAGTWSQITSVAASSFTGGAQVVIHISNYSVWALRVRISDAITGGGSLAVWAWGN